MLKDYISKLLNQLHNPIITFLTSISMFFAPVSGIVLSAIMLAIVDFLIRVVGVIKNEGYGSVKSNKISSTLEKCLLYFTLIIAAHILDLVFVQRISADFLIHIVSQETADFINKAKLASAISFIIVIRELKSIDENWKYTLGWSFVETFSKLTGNLIKLKSNKNVEQQSGE